MSKLQAMSRPQNIQDKPLLMSPGLDNRHELSWTETSQLTDRRSQLRVMRYRPASPEALQEIQEHGATKASRVPLCPLQTIAERRPCSRALSGCPESGAWSGGAYIPSGCIFLLQPRSFGLRRMGFEQL